VREIMLKDHVTVFPGASMSTIRSGLLRSRFGELFVIDEEERLHGTIMLSDLADAAFDTELDSLLNADDVCRSSPPLLAETDDLEAAMALMESVQESIVAVVDNHQEQRLTGYVRYRDVIRAYDRALMQARAEEYGEG
jgi:CIC family chloride channel protein